MLKKKSTVSVSVDIFLLKEDEYYTVYCPAVGVSSYATNRKEAFEAYNEAYDIFIEETLERGTLQKILLELGWTLTVSPIPHFIPPTLKANDIKRISKDIIDSKTTRIVLPVY